MRLNYVPGTEDGIITRIPFLYPTPPPLCPDEKKKVQKNYF